MFKRKLFMIMIFVQLCMRSYLCNSEHNGVMPMKSHPTGPSVIVDVDAGSDDAMAILTLLGTGTNVLAITCVNGNTPLDTVVVNVFKTLDTAKRLDIPVYRGAYEAMVSSKISDNFFGKDGFGDFNYPKEYNWTSLLQKEHAVTAMINIVNNNPGKVTLLCLGPLTNVALATMMDAKFLSKIKDIVVMGGSVEGIGNKAPGIEFNFHMDPVAVSIVLRKLERPMTLVPWETVLRTNISKEWRINTLGQVDRPTVKLMNHAERISLANSTQWICSDTIAAAIFRDPSIISRHSEYYCSIPLEGEETKGMILVDYANLLRKTPNVDIIQEIYVDRFEKLLFFFL